MFRKPEMMSVEPRISTLLQLLQGYFNDAEVASQKKQLSKLESYLVLITQKMLLLPAEEKTSALYYSLIQFYGQICSVYYDKARYALAMNYLSKMSTTLKQITDNILWRKAYILIDEFDSIDQICSFDSEANLLYGCNIAKVKDDFFEICHSELTLRIDKLQSMFGKNGVPKPSILLYEVCNHLVANKSVYENMVDLTQYGSFESYIDAMRLGDKEPDNIIYLAFSRLYHLSLVIMNKTEDEEIMPSKLSIYKREGALDTLYLGVIEDEQYQYIALKNNSHKRKSKHDLATLIEQAPLDQVKITCDN